MFQLRQTEILNAIIAGMPLPNQIKEIDLSTDSSAVYFTWRGHRLKVSIHFLVEEIEGSISSVSNLCILVEALIKSAYCKGA